MYLAVLRDGSDMGLLTRAIILALFYAALFYLPLRGSAAIFQWIRYLPSRKDRCRKQRLMRIPPRDAIALWPGAPRVVRRP